MARSPQGINDGACRLRSAPSAAPGGFQAIRRQVLRSLEDRFGDALAFEVRERIADEVLDGLRGATVDNYLAILAVRRAEQLVATES